MSAYDPGKFFFIKQLANLIIILIWQINNKQNIIYMMIIFNYHLPRKYIFYRRLLDTLYVYFLVSKLTHDVKKKMVLKNQQTYYMDFSRNIRNIMIKDALSYFGFQRHYVPQPYIVSSIRKKFCFKNLYFIIICEFQIILNTGVFILSLINNHRNCSGSETEQLNDTSRDYAKILYSNR